MKSELEGTISKYKSEGKYGFIHTYDIKDGLYTDVFFHVSETPLDRVEEGWQIKFDAEKTDEGYRAKNIEIISRKPRTQTDSQPVFMSDRSAESEKDDWMAERMKENQEDEKEGDETSDSPFSDDIKGSKNDILGR